MWPDHVVDQLVSAGDMSTGYLAIAWQIDHNRVTVRCPCGWSWAMPARHWRRAEAQLTEHLRDDHATVTVTHAVLM